MPIDYLCYLYSYYSYEKMTHFLNRISSSLSFQIRSKQESQLKVRNFLPPQAQEPEIFLVEKNGPGSTNGDLGNGDQDLEGSKKMQYDLYVLFKTFLAKSR